MGVNNNKLVKFLKSVDWFERPITLSYQRKKQFETAGGGCITIIIFIILTWTAFFRLWDTFFGMNKYILSAQTNVANDSEVMVVP
jgi:hypothetical protein